MNKEERQKAIMHARLKYSIKEAFLNTLGERVTRYLELDFSKMIPNEPFASVSGECILLYRDGYYFACIALCQSVAEAIVRSLCERNGR